MDRQCRDCKEMLPASSFGPNTVCKDGRDVRCRACKNLRQKAWRTTNPDQAAEHRRRGRLLHRYGITAEEYEQQLQDQGGRCALCREPCRTGKRLAVDHDHETGKLRGLLCSACNTGIGSLGDNPVLMDRAIEYILAGGVWV